MTTQIDPTKSYKTKYTKTYLDSVDTGIYTFLTSLGYSNSSKTIVAGEYLDGVLLVANTTKPDVVIDAAGDPVCFWGLNGCGGASTLIAIEDTNGNVTVLNGNGNIPLDTTYNAGYVVGGNLRVPGAKLEIASVYTTPFVQNVPSPTGFTDSANLISTSITNTTTKNRLYYLSLYGIEFATSCLQGQIGHTLKVTGAVTYTVVSATKGNAGTAGNCDNVQTLYQPLVLTPGQSITINCAYRWQNALAGAPTLTFNGARLELTVTSHGMEN